MEMEYRSQLHLALGLGYRLNEGPIYGSARYSVTELGSLPQRKLREPRSLPSNVHQTRQIISLAAIRLQPPFA